MLVPLLLAGCVSRVPGQPVESSVPGAVPIEVFEQAQPPALGSCLDTVHGGIGPLGPPETVACSGPHGGEVARVAEIPAALDGSFPTDDDLNSDAWGEFLYGDEGCGEFLLANRYLGARDQDNLLVVTSAYLPKRIAWDGGARWVACVVEYQIGILEDANAPGRMAQAMRGVDAASYRECWFGPEVVYDLVPCSQPHEAEPVGNAVSVAEGTPYPVDPLARRPLVEACTNEVIDYLQRDIPNGFAAGIYLPSAEDWSLFPDAECVILDASGRRWTGSAVDA